MKKTYNQPACLVVELSTVHMNMLAGSLEINNDPANAITNEDQILVKETTDVNLWDNEW